LTNTALEIGRVLSDSPEGSTGAKSDILGLFADSMMLHQRWQSLFAEQQYKVK